jgi:membrane-bound ClpP family serine protease
MNESFLWLGIALLAVALLLIIVEIFVPSGGLLSLIAAGCGIASVVFLFRYDTTWGLIGTLTLLIAGPMTVGFAFKVWPHTRMGKTMMGIKSDEELEREQLAELRERERQLGMVGKDAMVVVDLRPTGLIQIGGVGERIEASAEAGMIPAGVKVRITRLEDGRPKVRQIG